MQIPIECVAVAWGVLSAWFQYSFGPYVEDDDGAENDHYDVDDDDDDGGVGDDD